jgi:SNF2 family DNA or RNA helicase
MLPLWDHQKTAIAASLSLPDIALFFDVGTGKSRTAIDIIRHRCAAEGRLRRTLIIAPKKVRISWQREFEKYSKIHPRDVIVLKGSGAARCKQFREAVLEDHGFTKPRIIITNYESFDGTHKHMEELYEMFHQWNPEIMLADEAHRLKNPESKRARRIIQLADKAKHRYVLTGTPIANSAMDIFNVFRFLDGGKTFGVNFWQFRAVWFEDENAKWSSKPNYFPKYVPRFDTYKQFSDLIYKKAFRAVKSEVLDLPPFVREEVFVEMGDEQKRLYKEMKDEFIAYIDDIEKTDTPRAVVAQMAITKSQRLVQILTGYAKTEEGEIYRIKDNPRLEALRELLQDLAGDHKIIVWSIYHENYAEIRKLCDELKLGYAELHGATKRDSQEEMDRFETDPTCRIMIANQQGGGEGVTLTASDVSIYYSKNWSMLQDTQSEGRNYRGGSEKHKSITRIDITCPGTIDELISEALQNKVEIATKILDWKERL